MNLNNQFSKINLWQSYLNVWANMAVIQSELKIIPDWAGKEIAKNCLIENINIKNVDKRQKKNKRLILSLAEELSVNCGEAGAYVHWGGTTRNIIETGYTLIIKESYKILLHNLSEIMTKLSGLSDDYSSTPMLGRTLKRNALPITFGFKVSGWIDELSRLIERLNEAEKRVFSLKFGGAVGAMHGFGDQSLKFTQLLANKLNLTNILVPNRTALDTRIEYVELLANLGMKVGKISNEIYSLMHESIDELKEIESKGQYGSSTMPHKKNPFYTSSLVANCSILRSKITLGLESGLASHEGDVVSDKIIDNITRDSCNLSEIILKDFNNLLNILFIDTQRMENNLMKTEDYIASENLMLELAKFIGRNESHNLVHKIINLALEKNNSIKEMLINHKQINSHISKDRIKYYLNPKNYIGQSIVLSKRLSKNASKISKRITERLDELNA